MGEPDESVAGLLVRLREVAGLAAEATRLAARAAQLSGTRLKLGQLELVPGAVFTVRLPRSVDVVEFSVEAGEWRRLGRAREARFKAEAGCVVLELVGEREEGQQGREGHALAEQLRRLGSGERALLAVSLCQPKAGELVALARILGEEDWESIVGELRRINSALAEYVAALERVIAVARLVL
jgi:hypothetical protein